MIDYQQFCQIKAGQAQGLSVNQIAAGAGVHARTVKKWLSYELFEQSAGAKTPRASKLDAHDFSAKQVYQRLTEQK